jgi:hypothetical protein
MIQWLQTGQRMDSSPTFIGRATVTPTVRSAKCGRM